MSDGHSPVEANPQLYAIDESTMIPPIAKAAPTQSARRSERPEPRAFISKDSPTLPLWAVHFSYRPAFDPVRSEFFAITTLSAYAPRSKTESYFYHVEPCRRASATAFRRRNTR